MNRFWRYGYANWQPRWWGYVTLYRGSDEYGRRTLVIPMHPFGFLVWAYRTCHCEDCNDVREQTARWEREAQI